MQPPFTEGVKKSNKSLVQKQPSAATAEAVNRPAIKRNCYCRQVMKNGDTDIKVLPKIACAFLYQSLASPFPSEGETGQEQDDAVSRVLSDTPDHQMCKWHKKTAFVFIICPKLTYLIPYRITCYVTCHSVKSSKAT